MPHSLLLFINKILRYTSSEHKGKCHIGKKTSPHLNVIDETLENTIIGKPKDNSSNRALVQAAKIVGHD